MRPLEAKLATFIASHGEMLGFPSAKPCRLYQGPLVLDFGGVTHSVSGTVAMQHVPQPSLHCAITDAPDKLGLAFFSSAPVSIRMGARPGLSGSVLLGGPPMGENATTLTVASQLSRKPAKIGKTIYFNLLNWTNGDPKGLRVAAASEDYFQLASDKFRIALCSRESTLHSSMRLREFGGHRVTHFGAAEKVDGSTFTATEYDDLRMGLFLFCSFVAARQANSLLWLSEAKTGTPEPFLLYTPTIEQFRSGHSWSPSVFPEGSLSSLYGAFVKLYESKLWRSPLSSLVLWYCACNRASDRAGAIVMLQCSLELLAWLTLVEERSTVSETGFEGLPAADKIRLTLDRPQIGVAIPATMPALTQWVKKHKKTDFDGPRLLTEMRNAYVHPRRSKRAFASLLGGSEQLELQQLALWYVEGLLLHRLEYRGRVASRVHREWYTELQVPWSPAADSLPHSSAAQVSKEMLPSS